jgi:tetratricopeptide (TPR) repeat protein
VDIPKTLAAALDHHNAGRLADADALYRSILDAEPEHADATHLLGVTAFQRGRLDDAGIMVRRAIAIDGGVALYHANLGRVCKAADHPEQAAAALRRALELEPANAQTLSDLGGTLADRGMWKDAVECWRRALDLDPELSEAHYNFGLAMREWGRTEEAAASFHRAVAANPGFANAHLALGLAHQDQGRLDEAARCYRRAIEIDPGDVEALTNLGNVLRAEGRLDEAVGAYRRALTAAPERAEVHSNLGVAPQERGELEAALTSYDRALELNPEDAEAHRNRAQALLLAGRFAEGWEEYEWRWKARHLAARQRHFAEPRWDGSDLDGQTILVHAEQGYGDVIQFVRYAAMVAARGGRVVLECPMPLSELMTGAPGVEKVVAIGAPLPPFDIQVPLLGLPRLFETTADTIPGDVPYLTPDAAAVEKWRAVMGPSDDHRVGIVWQGNPRHRGDRLRSPGLKSLRSLFDTPGIDFYSLQKDDGARQLAELGLTDVVRDHTADFADFSDTAAAILNLDLIIACDTAVAHLAGALARPTWLLLPLAAEWRWLTERDDSPWYPTARLFRQRRLGDWDEVMARVGAALKRQAARLGG